MNHLLLDRHQPPVIDRVQHVVVERDRLKHLPERLLIGAVRRGGDTEDLQRRVGPVVINHPPVALRRRVMRLVDDQQAEPLRVKLPHPPAAISAGTLRLDGGDHDAGRVEQAAFGAVFAHLHVGLQPRHALNFIARLEDQFLPMRQHQRPPRKHPPDDIGEQDRLAATGRHDDQRGIILPPLGEDGVRRSRLIRAQVHSISLPLRVAESEEQWGEGRGEVLSAFQLFPGPWP